MNAEAQTPFLSVVVPAFNRATLINRAIASVFRDAGHDYELIVVDDGSSDETAATVAAIRDARLKLLRLPRNGGQCAARNRGAELARGEWLVFLDSDDELLPDSLDVIRKTARTVGPEVGKLLFGCLDDHGAVSPRPPLDGRTVDYAGYVRWQEETVHGASEALPCTRRSAFLQCPYPEMRGAAEGIHELDFAKRWNIKLCAEIVRAYHYDAANRLMKPDARAVIEKSAGIAAQSEQILQRHGDAMRQLAPTRWINTAREAAFFNFLSGHRGRGVHHSWTVLRNRPGTVNAWIALGVGLVGAVPLSRVWAMKNARQSVS